MAEAIVFSYLHDNTESWGAVTAFECLYTHDAHTLNKILKIFFLLTSILAKIAEFAFLRF